MHRICTGEGRPHSNYGSGFAENVLISAIIKFYYFQQIIIFSKSVAIIFSKSVLFSAKSSPVIFTS